MRERILPEVQLWAERGMCHTHFLSTFAANLRDIEEDARNTVSDQPIKRWFDVYALSSAPAMF